MVGAQQKRRLFERPAMVGGIASPSRARARDGKPQELAKMTTPSGPLYATPTVDTPTPGPRLPRVMDVVILRDADGRDNPGWISNVWEPSTAMVANVYTIPVGPNDTARSHRKVPFSLEPKEGTWRYLDR